MDTELFEHWFHSFAGSAGFTLHVENLYGSNNHHIIESCFKAVARALRTAVEIDPRKADSVPSTKGTLGDQCRALPPFSIIAPVTIILLPMLYKKHPSFITY